MDVIADLHDSAMSKLLDFMMEDGRSEKLFGEGPERALDSFRRFTTARAKPSIYMEMPLLGAPSYDVLIGIYRPIFAEGARLADTEQKTAQAAVDWAANWHGEKMLEMLFELDVDGGEQQHPGIHCRHRGQLDAMEQFYEAIGESWRAPLYRAVAERTPEGWDSTYAAVFPGRSGQVTRIEMRLEDKAAELAAGNPAHVRDCFDAIGFTAYDQTMLETVAHLIALRPAHTVQFDILADGTLGDTFALASYVENEGAAARTIFNDGCPAAELCSAYERLGIADDRWRALAGAVRATKSTAVSGYGIRSIISLALPCCAKAKWKGASLLPGKFYMTATVC